MRPKETMGILVVDDEESVRRVIRRFLEAQGYPVFVAASGGEALAVTHERPIDIVLTDLRMPGMDGLELLGTLKSRHPEVDVILMSAYSDLDSAIRALRLKAYDYLLKPLDLEYLGHSIDRALEKRSLQWENTILRKRLQSRLGGNGLVGTSPQMREVFDIVERVAENDSTVLIQGESGTGKELVARSIHSHSLRASKPFVPVNCAAVVPDLLESELFGHVKGAFSGAIRDNLGLFRAAEGGTVFLDEIAEIPPPIQAKLLRTLQERSVRPVGDALEIAIDVRVIAATNRRLEQAIKNGDLRKDLFYRLNVVSLEIPPLRERREDIPVLIHHFMEKFKRKFPGRQKKISPEAMDALLSYHYPGNVRELENAIERAFALGKRPYIGLEDLPPEVRLTRRAQPFGDDFPTLEEVEIRMIREALARAGGDRRKATRMLGIARSTLYRKLTRYGLA